jgi:RNA polymerase sigma-70 factor, ECF subfamily
MSGSVSGGGRGIGDPARGRTGKEAVAGVALPRLPRHGRTSEQATSALVSRAVKRAQEGDREALGFLYARYADNVCGYVRSIVHDQHEAEDVTQHVFTKLIHVIGKYEERDVPFFAWILRVARNVAVDHIRSQRLIPVEEVRTSDEGGGDPAGGEPMNDLREAVAKLPRDQREVLVLRHFAGLAPTEIAERMGRSEGSVHGLHHRGRRALTADLTSRGAAPATLGSLRGKAAPREASGQGLLAVCRAMRPLSTSAR